MVIETKQMEWKSLFDGKIKAASVVVMGCDEVVVLPNGTTITGVTGVLEMWWWPESGTVKTAITSEAEYYSAQEV